jgi:hypothetical protein
VNIRSKLQDVTPDDYDFIFDTNVKGAFFVAQEVGKRMLARADGSAPGTYIGGRIINIASVAALKAVPNIGVYCMSKSAVVQMTKAMALEWGRFGINVNALCPGYIATELNEELWTTEAGAKLMSILPRKRVGKAEDLDGLIVLLGQRPEPFRERRRHRGRRRIRSSDAARRDRHRRRAGRGRALGTGVRGAAHGRPLRHGRHHGCALRGLRRRSRGSQCSRGRPPCAGPMAIRRSRRSGSACWASAATTCCWPSASRRPAPRCPASSSARFPSG